MKTIYLILVLSIVSVLSFTSNAQSVSLPQASLTAAPMGTLENNGNAIGELNFSETSGVDVPSTAAGQPNLRISINFQYVELSEADVDQITGSLLDYFTPYYDVEMNLLIFNQNSDIPGDWSGSVAFPMDVTQNSTQSESFNGFNANISAIDSNTNAEGNASIFTFTDEKVLFVNTNNILTYKVFPNPTQDILNITLENNFATMVEIFDISGKVILNEKYNGDVNDITLDISHFASAVYLLKVTSNEATFSTRIIRQ